VIAERVAECAVPIVYVNLCGGQDELVFEGNSFVMDAKGTIVMRAPAYTEGLYGAQFERREFQGGARRGHRGAGARVDESVYRALVLGVRDYVQSTALPAW